MSQSMLVAVLHALTGAAIVGGQFLVTWWVFRSNGTDQKTVEFWTRFERNYRGFVLFMCVAAIVTGLLYLRVTLVSKMILISTPYGPLLWTKSLLTLVFALSVLLSPFAHGNPNGSSSFAARGGSLIAAAAGAALVVLSLMMRYV